MISAISGISKDWTLFLDRDGVINERLVGDYVKQWDEFRFTDGTIEAIAGLSDIFGKILVVTNQQGVGKGIMSREQLDLIHEEMISEIKEAGGRIDKIYSCTKLEEEHPFCRKPNPGMALQARRDFPDIKFKRSIMVGDSMSDLKFGKMLGMKTVLIACDNSMAKKFPRLTDVWFISLRAFAHQLIHPVNKNL
jgi:histidinol-phosphate phosphatase family protein